MELFPSRTVGDYNNGPVISTNTPIPQLAGHVVADVPVFLAGTLRHLTYTPTQRPWLIGHRSGTRFRLNAKPVDEHVGKSGTTYRRLIEIHQFGPKSGHPQMQMLHIFPDR